MLSTDEKILTPGTPAHARMRDYAALFKELHVIIYTRNNNVAHHKDNLWCYPTNSKSKISFLKDAYQIGKRILKERGSWIISTQDPFETGIVGYALKRKYGVPLQIQIHTDFLSPYFKRESFKNRVRVAIGLRILNRADQIRIVSLRIKKSLEARGYDTSRITTLPIFVEKGEEMQKEKKNHDITFLMASRLTKEKNVSLAIRAMRDVIFHYPKTRLLIIGSGPEKENLQLQITNYQLQNNITLEPWNEEGRGIYAQGDVFLITSNYEGYGRTAIEAMTAGLPVIMTNVGLAGDLVRNGIEGIIIPVDDTKQLIIAMRRIIEDKALRETLSDNAKEIKNRMGDKETYLRTFKEILTFKPKLIYAVPRMDSHDATHFAYLSRFAEELEKEYDLATFVESGIKGKNLFLRAFKTFRMMRAWYAQGYRVAYVHYSFLTAWCAKRAGMRVLYWNCGEPWNYTRPWWREWFERHVYRKIDTLITGTEGLKKQYAQHYNIPLSRIEVMPNWIEIRNEKEEIRNEDKQQLQKKLNISESSKIILFVHRLSKRKGAHHLPEILNTLRNENIVLLIAGEGPERENIQLLITNYQLQDKVRFLGPIPHSQLLNYYLLSDMFLMPSDEEGFPHVLLEAMAAGLPFVATDVGGVREIVPKEVYPYIVPAGDVVAMSNAIKKLLASSDSFTPLLQEWVMRYDLSHAINQFKAVVTLNPKP